MAVTLTSGKTDVTPVFSTLEEAVAFAKAEVAAGKTHREVYEMTHPGNDTVYLVALNIGRANDHAMRVLRDRIGVKVAKPGQRQQTIEELAKGLDALDPSKMTAEQRRQLKVALLAADRADRKAEYTFQEYDVLQISHDKGEWKDFATLRNETEGAIAKQRVADPKTANIDGIVEFRIVRKGETVCGK